MFNIMRPGFRQPVLACVLFSATVAAAQVAEKSFTGPVQPNSVLTIDRAVDIALQRNPDLQLALTRVTGAQGRLRHESRLLPSNPALEFGIAERDAGADAPDSTDLEIRLAQEFWIGGQGRIRRRAAESRVERERAMVGLFDLTVAAQTRAAYLDLVVAREAVATAQRTVDVSQTVHDASRSRLDAGEATRIELNTARVALGRAKSALAEASGEVNQARQSLAGLMGIELPAALELKGAFNPAPLQLPARTELLNRVAQQRSDLAAAVAGVLAASEDLKLSRRLLIPNLTVFGFYAEEEGDQIAGAGVSLPIPLWHRFGGEREQALANLQAAQIERDRLLLEIRLGMERAVSDYRAARERLAAVGGEMLRAAEDNVELVFEAFREGQVGIMAVATAQESLLQSRTAYLDAQYAFVRAALDLERVSGGLLAVRDASVVRPDTSTTETKQNQEKSQ